MLTCNSQAYLQQLQKKPLRTKMLTSGTLSALQELLASWLAKDRSKHGHYFSSRIPKMAAYGAFISAPLGHFLISMLQKLFAGRTSLRAKILQILVSNLVVRLCAILPLRLVLIASIRYATGLSNPEFGVPRIHGRHCWGAYIPSSSSYRQSWLHARDEDQLGYVPSRACLCAEVPSGAYLAAVLQHHRVCDRDVHQYTY